MVNGSLEKSQKSHGMVVAKAWPDDGFKAGLISDPATALKDSEVECQEGLDAKVVENTDNLSHFILLPEPGEEELSV